MCVYFCSDLSDFFPSLWLFVSLSLLAFIIRLVVYLWFFLFFWGEILLLSTSLLDLLLLHCTSVGDLRDLSSIPKLGRFPGEGIGNPLQYSCLENHIERGVHKVAKIQTQLKRLRTHGFWILMPSLSFVSNIFLFPLWFLQWSISCLAAYFLASMCLCSWQLFFFPYSWFLVSRLCGRKRCLIWFQFS